MIKFSIDRLAKVYVFQIHGDVDDDDEYRSLAFHYFTDCLITNLNALKPKDVDLEYVGNLSSMQVYLVVDDDKQPLLNVSLVRYKNAIRVDGNPKRWVLPWVQDVIGLLNDYAVSKNMANHNTQVDLAVDLINEGHLADDLTFYKPNVKRTSLFNSVTGAKETEYFGTRLSNSFLRIYNKRVEREKDLTKQFARRKRKIIVGYDVFMDLLSNVTHDMVLDNFSDLELDTYPGIADLTVKNNFIDALDWVLAYDKEQEKQKLPAQWKRIELVLRTKKLNSNGMTLDEKSVLDYLKNFHNADLKTISDPILRAVTVGVELGYIDPAELSNSMNAQRRAILKFDEIVVLKSKSNNYYVKSIADFNKMSNQTDFQVMKTIKKYDDFTLRDKIIEEFYQVKDSLNLELQSYSIK